MYDLHGSQPKAANYCLIFLHAEVRNVLQRRWIPGEKVQRQRKSLVRSDMIHLWRLQVGRWSLALHMHTINLVPYR